MLQFRYIWIPGRPQFRGMVNLSTNITFYECDILKNKTMAMSYSCWENWKNHNLPNHLGLEEGLVQTLAVTSKGFIYRPSPHNSKSVWNNLLPFNVFKTLAKNYPQIIKPFALTGREESFCNYERSRYSLNSEVRGKKIVLYTDKHLNSLKR